MATGTPYCFVNAGLKSNVSTCDGPPCMNKKITRFARAGKCVRVGTKGFTNAACTLLANNPLSANMPKPALVALNR